MVNSISRITVKNNDTIALKFSKKYNLKNNTKGKRISLKFSSNVSFLHIGACAYNNLK